MNESLLRNVVPEPECWECHRAARILIQECIRPHLYWTMHRLSCPTFSTSLQHESMPERNCCIVCWIEGHLFCWKSPCESVWVSGDPFVCVTPTNCLGHQLEAALREYICIRQFLGPLLDHEYIDSQIVGNPVRRVVKWVSRIRGLFMLSWTADWLQCCFVTLSIIYFLCCPLFLFPSIF